MIITRVSRFSGNMHSWDIPVTEEQIDRWKRGCLIQNAMPHLTADEREFIMTGTTPNEFNQIFGEDEYG
jgi:hypothetical protein